MQPTEKPTATLNEELPLITTLEEMPPEMIEALSNGCEEGEEADE